MRLLVDTDAFCKLAVGGVLDEAVGIFGVDLTECRRLPALPHMLRRGRLRKLLGDAVSDGLLPRAESVPVLPSPSTRWLDKLASIHGIDPGEAQLFALGAQEGLIVVSGDKRALRGLKDVDEVRDALAGRIVVLEALLIRLCDEHGVDVVRERIGPLASTDKMVAMCFSPGNHDPVGALMSYYNSLVTELDPLELWNPRPQDDP